MSRFCLFSIAVVALVFVRPAGADQERCVKRSSEAIAKARAKAKAWTRASFERALAKRGLTKVRLTPQTIELHRGIRGNPKARARTLPMGKAVKATVGGQRGVFIGGPTEWSGNARRQPLWRFVQNERGEIFKLVKRPRPTDRRIAVCGCEPRRCGPYGSGCPACGSTAQTVYGPLPDGAVYRGELAVDYPSRTVSLDFVKTAGCVHRRCPAPPP